MQEDKKKCKFSPLRVALLGREANERKWQSYFSGNGVS